VKLPFNTVQLTKRQLRLITIAAIIILSAIIYPFFTRGDRAFPDLSQGEFAGILTYNPSPKESARVLPWYVSQQGESRELSLFIGEQDTKAQQATYGDSSGLSSAVPLIVEGEISRLKLVGHRAGDNSFEGTFTDTNSNKTGVWKLDRLSLSSLPAPVEADVQAWGLVWKEYHDLGVELNVVQGKVAEQRAKADKLIRVAVDDDALRKKADSRFDNAAVTLQDARRSMEDLQVKLGAVDREITLAQRVAPRGRLVLLARESIEREARWIEQSLNMGTPDGAPGFAEAYERAQRVQSLKEAIAAERRRVDQLHGDTNNPVRSPEAVEEEEFYRGFQH